MAYTPTVWHDGDIVTAELLNKLENGVANAGGGIYNVPLTKNDLTYTSTKTTGEILEAIESGMIVVFSNPQESGNIHYSFNSHITGWSIPEEAGGVYSFGIFNDVYIVSDSLDGYPRTEGG